MCGQKDSIVHLSQQSLQVEPPLSETDHQSVSPWMAVLHKAFISEITVTLLR